MPLTLENRNGKIVAVDDQGNVQSIKLGDTVHDSVTSDSVNTDDAEITDDLDVQGGVTGNVAPLWKAEFEMEFVSEVLGSGSGDGNPLWFHKRHFENDKYRLIWFDSSQNHKVLEETADPAEGFTQIDSDFLPVGQLHDGFVRKDGTFILYGGSSSTNVYSGPDLNNISLVGEAVSGMGDTGVAYDPVKDEVHIYGERDPTAGVSDDYLDHYKTPADGLTNDTKVGTAIDVSDKQWKTGDPIVESFAGFQYMFIDRTTGNDSYDTAVARSSGYDNWTLINDSLHADTDGGDLELTRFGHYYYGITEFTGADQAGLGLWRLAPRPASHTQDWGYFSEQTETRHLDLNTENGIAQLFLNGESGTRAEYAIGTQSGTRLGRFFNLNNQPILETSGYNGKALVLGFAGSGNKELYVENSQVRTEDGVSFFPEGGIKARSSPPTANYSTGSYLDDGTNTGDGNPGWRYTTDGGSTWSDMN